MTYSKNPIIDRFLQLTIDEGKSVRGVALAHSPNAGKTVVFSLADGTNCELVTRGDRSVMIGWWRDSSDLMKKFRHIDLNPVV